MLGGTSGVFNRHEAEAGQPLTVERSPESPVGESSPYARRVATSAEAGQAARRSYRWCRPPTLGSATILPMLGGWMALRRDPIWERPTEEARSAGRRRTRGVKRLRAASCRRSARFSRASSARVQSAERSVCRRVRSRASMAGCCMMAGVACQAYEFAPPPTENQDPGRRAGEGQRWPVLALVMNTT